jgi:site-specific DNA-adenine methylase
MKNFPLTYYGNKTIDIKHFKHLLPSPETLDTVAEPFAGSFSIIRNVYPKVKNLICADNDHRLITRLTNIFNNLDDFEKERSRLNAMKGIKTSAEMRKELVDNKYFNFDDYVCRGITCKRAEIEFDDLKEVFDKIKWFDNFDKAVNCVSKNKKGFIFFDPPYFMSDNKQYYGSNITDENKKINDNTSFLIRILEYFKDPTIKCKMMLIINKSELMCYLFDGFIRGEYEKLYMASKRKDTLLIITNYNIE